MRQRWDTVALIGVGLIGGSIGLALRKRKLAGQVIGIGRRRSSLAKALALGCVTKTTTSIRRGVGQASLIVVCTPVEQIPEHVAEAAQHCPADALITDAGSTKALLVGQALAALAGRSAERFVGSHPLAGSEKAGAAAARADLLDGRLVVVTPTKETPPATTDRIRAFWQSLGARVVFMSPDQHDASIARTSHLPHIVASALAAATPEHLLPLTAAGWCDTTRVAAGDAELWRQILLANCVHSLKALADFERVLARLRTALETGDGPLLAEILAEGKRRRDAVAS
ncbi:MAG: prephenate dehydrogenase/arogenate dehydrogenase family protein [Pirellulaceae bacterium]